jgi:ubiquinol-cytochrome c reductase cytochrome c1 subunit
MKPEEYDAMVGDLVGFLHYLGEPMGELRKKLGIAVLIALGILFVFSYALKRNYWQDIH